MNSSNFAYYDKPVYIGDRVWIGTRAMIMPGVSVGEGAMIILWSYCNKRCCSI